MTERAEDLAKARVADDLGAGWPSGYEAGVKAERERRSLQDERDGGWQDIATAPRDGTEIIGVFSNDYGYQDKPTVYGPWTVAFRDGKWTSSWDGMRVIDWSSDFGNEYKCPDMDPTHWRPLPSPPHTFTPDQITARAEQ